MHIYVHVSQYLVIKSLNLSKINHAGGRNRPILHLTQECLHTQSLYSEEGKSDFADHDGESTTMIAFGHKIPT